MAPNVVLHALLSSAHALTIEHPATIPLSTGSGGELWDVVPMEDLDGAPVEVWVATDVAASCTVGDSSGDLHTETTVCASGTYTADISMSGGLAGAWYVDCTAGTASASEDFFVVDALEPRIWIDPANDIADIAQEYDDKGASFNHYDDKVYWTDQ